MTEKSVDLASTKVLVVGAGGIGCELLKNLVLSGFHDIEVVRPYSYDLGMYNACKGRYGHHRVEQLEPPVPLPSSPHWKIQVGSGSCSCERDESGCKRNCSCRKHHGYECFPDLVLPALLHRHQCPRQHQYIDPILLSESYKKFD